MKVCLVLSANSRGERNDVPKHLDLTVSGRSVFCLCPRHRQIIDPLVTDKSRYIAQPRPIIAYYIENPQK